MDDYIDLAISKDNNREGNFGTELEMIIALAKKIKDLEARIIDLEKS